MISMRFAFLAICLCGCLDTLKSTKAMPESAPAPAKYKKCQDVSDCVLVNVSCNQCCEQDAINRKDSLDYVSHKERTCVGIPGGVCDCCNISVEAVCERGMCQLKTLNQSCR